MFLGSEVIAASLYERDGRTVPFCLVTKDGDMYSAYDVDWSRTAQTAYYRMYSTQRNPSSAVYLEGAGPRLTAEGVVMVPVVFALPGYTVEGRNVTTNEWPADCDLQDLVERHAPSKVRLQHAQVLGRP